MYTIRVIFPDTVREIPAREGSLLSHALHGAGIAVALPCGGGGRCGKCSLRASGGLDPAPDENGCCLACSTRITGDAAVWIGPDSGLRGVEGLGVLPEFALDPLPGEYGLALDIGTTTLAAQLVSLSDGRLLQEITGENPQRALGHDVIGRIQAALEGRGELLRSMIADAATHMQAQLCSRAGIDASRIHQRVFTGNTAMLYLCTGRNPAALASAPFEADCLFDLEEEGRYLPPCLGAYVGADIACALLASDMVNRHRTALLIDIGTNGEICLLHAGRLLCCATAAGPAFEGVGISCGVSSVPGAIESVWVENGEMKARTIGDAQPVGLCGSGLIDAVAALLQLEWLDETGYLDQEEVCLAEGVKLTRRDIRMVQLAKGSICAGVLSLLCEAGITPGDVEAVYIAGGFGRHICIESAVRIGLIPPFGEGKVHIIGNAALSGAVMLLLNRGARNEIRSLAARAECINLAQLSRFQQLYPECMLFPEE